MFVQTELEWRKLFSNKNLPRDSTQTHKMSVFSHDREHTVSTTPTRSQPSCPIRKQTESDIQEYACDQCFYCPMNCYFQHRLFLILCVCRSVCVGPALINCGTKIKRSHFLLVTPATRVLGYVPLVRVWLQDGCVFL